MSKTFAQYLKEQTLRLPYFYSNIYQLLELLSTEGPALVKADFNGDNFDDLYIPPPESDVPTVRSDVKDYLRNFNSGPIIGRAQLDYYLSPQKRKKSHFMFTAGILEEMFSGYGFEYLYFNPENKYWEIKLNSSEKSILFENTYRGVTEKFELKSEDLSYHEVLEINNLSEHSETFQENVKLVFENEKLVINSSLHLVDLILEKGKKGAQISRYKGLGEMKAGELWDTAMNPETRTLIKVTLADAKGAMAKASDMFEVLMGNDVSKRKLFIEKNAKDVRFLDV